MIQHDSASIQLVRSSLSLPHSGLLPQMNQSVLTVAAPHFLSMILRNLQGLFAGSLPHRKALNLLNDIKCATKICRSFCLKCNLQFLCNSLCDLKVLGASTCSFQSHVYPVLSMAGLCCCGTNVVSFSMFQHTKSTKKGPTPAIFSLIISFIIHNRRPADSLRLQTTAHNDALRPGKARLPWKPRICLETLPLGP